MSRSPLSAGQSEAIARLCRDLVRAPSPSGYEGPAAAVLTEALPSLGWGDLHVDAMGSVSARIGSGGPPFLIFNGHMDNVDAGDLLAWTHPPFDGHVEDGVLYGRGACDMKGGLAAMAGAGNALGPIAVGLRGTVYLVAVVHEETCEGVAMAEWVRSSGVRPDFVVLGEPSGLKVALGHRGRAEFRLRTWGRGAHGSAPERGENAIYAMARAALAVERLNDSFPCDSRLGKGSVAMTTIAGGVGVNVVPDFCQAQVDRRLTVGETAEGAIAELRQCAADAGARTDVGLLEYTMRCYTGLTRQVRQEYAPWFTPADAELSCAVTAAAEAVLGRAPETHVWAFSTDGAYTAGLAGIPTIGFGPGEERFAHTTGDQVRLEDVVTASHVYARLATDLLT